MSIKIFDKTEVVVALGAVRAVAPDPSPAQDALLTAVAGLHGVDLYPRLLPKPSAARTARDLRDGRCRRRVLELAVALAMSEGDVAPATLAALTCLARTLDHSDSDVRRLRERASHHYLRGRVDFTRRTAARFFGSTTPNDFERRAWAGLGDLLAVRADPLLAGRYHALEHLHPLSFGHAIWAHYRQNRFRFPGEGGGIPERLLSHDVAHVLSGYGTDCEGELQQSAFQTGCSRDDGFMPLYFGIVQFQFAAGMAADPNERAPLLDFEKVGAALARGASCLVDVTDAWDFWAFLPWSLSDLRRDLGVPALARSAA
jgi:hypothetical protein